ncbi:TRAP transporter small permease [Celeribacter indicus]|uniref:TRAP transporter small permease protein n=1 Tax=Celeribacter indicus TaxID=1208324 RepID=A0A0B5E3R0_9RHOB|nr:TRAP transporter small permease [Celeribacter indicus]AJE47691.1 TRAP-T family transporter, DctQ (4 TMs) subunit [Celeribacter indicus]SDW14390.1 TRAP-type C4-dicarboxylate transport system, small permease component [Celeribacter indicus]
MAVPTNSPLGNALRGGRRISEIAVTVSGIVMALMVVHVVADVGLRYLSGVPLSGTTEIVSRYYMVTLIFLPIAFVHVTDQNICASLVSDMLSAKSRVLLDCLTSLLMVVFGVLLAWRTGAEALRATGINEQIQTAAFFLPTWPSRWIPVLAMGLLVIVSGLGLAVDIERFIRHDIPDGPDPDRDEKKVTSL